ncbi:RagB/SusD family nutrient uptake outer membrane protein [Bacteroides fragilis]|nr:RagB/SusD family nutrient uptake outer membrane protein [Bacteroides fragilis]
MCSKIKHILLTACCFTGAGLMTSCNDGFMDRFPETSITEKVFFSSPADLETYTNGMYGYIGASYSDTPSDNMLYPEDTDIYKMMRGEYRADNIGKWSWSNIRTVNFMLARTGRVEGDRGEINHYIGLARMFRALVYYSKVKDYSDVPWYSHDLQTTDIDLLYKPQDPRALVVDSIMVDLDFAVTHMKTTKSTTRIYRDAALAVQARIALHEGTFRKYHPELKLNDGDRFLKIAVEACQKIMDTKSYSLSTTKESGLPAYQSLFCSTDLTQNPEMILVADYDKALGRLHNAQAQFDYNTGLSRSLMEDYLVVKDGHTEYFHQVEGYKTKTVLEVFENRDPRLEQTFMKPGVLNVGTTEPHRTKLNLGGYPQIKFRPLTFDQIDWGKSYTDLPIIRYAEVLLMYAEAKAELGILTQDDVNQTINLIRQRAGMPDASLDDWLANIDPVQDERYSNVQSAQKGAVLEVRRERRIELACEGFRYGDLMRWGCGKLFEAAPEGAYIPGMGYYDVTGDGQPDVAIVEKKADIDKIPEEDKQKYKLTVYALEGNTIGLTEGTKGYIYLVAQHNKYTFVSPKYYYYPVATKDITVNENLYQNPFWE